MGLALATAAGVWVNVLILFCLAYGRGWTAPSRTLIVTAGGVLAACIVLAACTLGGLPLIDRLMPSLPRFRELAVLTTLGLAGLVAYGATLLVALRLCGVRLRRV